MSNAQVKAIVFSNIGSACLLGGIYVESKGDYVWAFLLFASFLLNMHTVYRLLIEAKNEPGYKPDWKVIIKVGRKQHVMKRSYPKPGEPNRCETCSLYHICIGRYKHRDEELSSTVADVCRITDFGFQEYKADKL